MSEENKSDEHGELDSTILGDLDQDNKPTLETATYITIVYNIITNSIIKAWKYPTSEIREEYFTKLINLYNNSDNDSKTVLRVLRASERDDTLIIEDDGTMCPNCNHYSPNRLERMKFPHNRSLNWRKRK